jgi:hypothetical protein
MQATEITDYPFKVQEPAQELHITHNITKNSLLSIGKFAATNYITIFDKEEVNIYDSHETIIAVTRGAILPGWWDAATKLWHIPLVAVVRNNNTDTVIVNQLPTEFLPNCPSPTDAFHNVYELKTQPELVCYYHAAAGFPTKTKSRPSGTNSLPCGQVLLNYCTNIHTVSYIHLLREQPTVENLNLRVEGFHSYKWKVFQCLNETK